MNIVKKLTKIVILAMSLIILTFSLNAKRGSFISDPYIQIARLDLNNINEDTLKKELQKVRHKLDYLYIFNSSELSTFNLGNLKRLQDITISNCPYLKSVNISNCDYLQKIFISGSTPSNLSIKINNCPLLQLFAISDSDINDQELQSLLSPVKDRLSTLYLSSCKNLQDIDLKIYPSLDFLSLDDCPGLQQNIKELRATGIEIETFE